MPTPSILHLSNNSYNITLENFWPFDYPVTVLPHIAACIYDFTTDQQVTSQHRVTCQSLNHGSYSCLLRAGRGPTGIHQHSALIDGECCLVAVGSYLVALRLPQLQVVWATEVDSVTCFGVYQVPQHQSYISHGELDIARIDYDGAIMWSNSGADIFSNGFQIFDTYLDVVDFMDTSYRMEFATGEITLIK